MALLLAMATGVSASSIPTLAAADVDGAIGEWNLIDDLFAQMFRAGNTSKQVESTLYLRYDVDTTTLYLLVLSEPAPNTNIEITPAGDAFVKVGGVKLIDASEGDDDSVPDFAWVGLSGSHAEGFEASVTLGAGTYPDLNVHVNVFSDGESQTSAVPNRSIPLVLPNTNILIPLPASVWMSLPLLCVMAVVGYLRQRRAAGLAV